MSPLPRSTRPSSTPVDKVQPFCRSLAPIRSKSNQAPDRNAVAFVRNALQNCTMVRKCHCIEITQGILLQILSQITEFNFSIFKIIFFITFIDFAQNPTRIPNGNNIRGQIFCDNTSCPDNYIVPNRNPRYDYNPSTNPAIFTYVDRKIILIHFFPQFR